MTFIAKYGIVVTKINTSLNLDRIYYIIIVAAFDIKLKLGGTE